MKTSRKSPRVMIVCKESTYKHSFCGKRAAKNYGMNKAILNRFIRTHQQHYKVLEKIEETLKSRKIRYSRIKRSQPLDFSDVDLVITVGGDGTFLEAARSISDQIILGVNSDTRWSVGNYCGADSGNFAHVLDSILDGKASFTLMQRLKVRLVHEKVSMNVLNDFLITHQNPASMSHYYITIDGKREEQRSSGVWVATSAGSTGAIKSAGGRILSRTGHEMQYLPRELYHGLRAAPVFCGGVLDMSRKLTFTSLMTRGMIYFDGSHAKAPFRFGERILLSRSACPLKVLWK